MHADGVLTMDEAATYLRVTVQTVHNMIKRGELPGYKVGRLVRIPASDVLALVGQLDDTEVARERIEQGLPPRVTDPDLLARVAAIVATKPVTATYYSQMAEQSGVSDAPS